MKGRHNEGLYFVIISCPNFVILWLFVILSLCFETPSVCVVLTEWQEQRYNSGNVSVYMSRGEASSGFDRHKRSGKPCVDLTHVVNYLRPV